MLLVRQSYQYQRGISLLECLLYIIVTLAIVASMVAYFKVSSRTQKLADAMNEATNILQVAAQYWESNQYFDKTIFNEQLIAKSGLLPVVYTKLSSGAGAGKIVIATPWTEDNSKSKITIGVTDQEAGKFDLTFTGIPGAVCYGLAQQLSTIGYPVTPNCKSPTDSSVVLHVQQWDAGDQDKK